MNDTTSYREKGRAVFLAAIMVLSVVAMSVAFAGSAAASANYDPDNPWQGQDVSVDVSDPNGEYDLRLVTDSDSEGIQSSEFVREISAGDDAGQAVVNVSTDDLDAGEYFVEGSDAGEDETFEVRIQDLDAAFDDDSVTDDAPNSETELDIDSNRGTYYLNASADGDLDDGELFSIFVDADSDQNLIDLTSGEDDDTIQHIIDAEGDIDGVSDWTADDINSLEDFAEFVRDEGTLIDQAYLDDIEENGLDSSDEDEVYFGDFHVALYADDADDDDADADEKVALLTGGDVEADVDFAGIDEGEYTFDFNVTDTEASSSADITVSESDATADFDQSVYTETAGDILTVTVELEDTDDAWIQFGDEDAGFVDIIYVEDDTDDGEVEFMVNLRTIGSEDYVGDQVVYSDDDIAESYIHHNFLTSGVESDHVHQANFWEDDDLEDPHTSSNDAFSAYLEELDLLDEDDDDPTKQIVRPLQATNYDLIAANDGDFIAEDGESDVGNEIGYATVDLTTPSIDGVNTYVAPSNAADDEDDLSEVLPTLTERENVAIEDQLVIEIEATGLYGALTAKAFDGGDDWSALSDGFDSEHLYELIDEEGEGINLVVEDEDTVGNQEPNQLNLQNADDDEIYVLANHVEGQLYIVVDTDASGAFSNSIGDGDNFNVEFEYETDDDERFRFEGSDNTETWGGAGGDDDDAAYPYFGADSTQSVSTTFTLEDAAVEFDNLDADDNVQIEASDEAVLTGETNVAPGSDATLRLTNAGDTESFLATEDADIDSDGTFASDAFDFGDRDVDDEASIDFRIAGSSIDSADGIFVESVEEEDDDEPVEEDDDEPVEEDDDAPSDDDAPAPSDDDAPAPSDDDEPVDTEDDGVPGFGLAIAVVALLAAAMLALRRQN